ncbi:MAG: hypothetical protein Q9162_002726 [Coniocarpon cinnabarinum]
MVYLSTSQSWLHESQLLLQAHPVTARVTTKYTPNPLPKKRRPNPRKRKRGQEPNPDQSTTEQGGSARDAGKKGEESDGEAPPPGTLTMKTYDPVSGVCLKYRTVKQQEVGRLIGVGGLASIAQVMVGNTSSDPTASTSTSTSADVKPSAKTNTLPLRRAADGAEADTEGGMDDEGGATESAVLDGEGKVEGKDHRKKKSVSFAAEVEVRKPNMQAGSGGGGGGSGGGGKKKKKKR